MFLSEHQQLQWRNQGFTIRSELFEPEIINQSCKYLKELYQNKDLRCQDFGSQGKLEFPCNNILDKISIHDRLICCVQELLITENILLVQADTWGKEGISSTYDSNSNQDQRMHMDYGNNTFLHPPKWENPEAVSIIIYLSDISETQGGTALVPNNTQTQKLYNSPYIDMPGIKNYQFNNNYEHAESYFRDKYPKVHQFRQKLYQQEITPQAKIGDILFYRLDLWHRGTPVKIGKVRFVMNLVFKKKECFWINQWNPGWTQKMYYGHLEKLFIEMSPKQRGVLGVPLPGDPYWNFEKLDILKVRYPGINVLPYIQGIIQKNNKKKNIFY